MWTRLRQPPLLPDRIRLRSVWRLLPRRPPGRVPQLLLSAQHAVWSQRYVPVSIGNDHHDDDSAADHDDLHNHDDDHHEHVDHDNTHHDHGHSAAHDDHIHHH